MRSLFAHLCPSAHIRVYLLFQSDSDDAKAWMDGKPAHRRKPAAPILYKLQHNNIN